MSKTPQSTAPDDGKEELELELSDECMEYLEQRATESGRTVDQVVEDLLRVAIADEEARREADNNPKKEETA